MNDLDKLDLATLSARKGEKWSQYSAEVIPAWVADMDFEIAEPIRNALIERVNEFDVGYPAAASATQLSEIFAERVNRRFDWQIDPGQVDLFNDVVQAIYFGLMAFSEPHEGVIIQTPIYPPFIGATEETNRRIIECPLVAGTSRYEIDFDQLEHSIDAKTKILLFCNPHNPSGRAFDRRELERLGELALKHSLFIISDEIHADLVLVDDRKHLPIASIDPQIAARTLTLMSASKAFNMAGVCMAFVVYGSKEVRDRFDSIPRHLRGGLSALSVAGVSAALTQCDDWLSVVVKKLKQNRALLSEHVSRKWPKIGFLPPEATYLAWLNCRDLELVNPYRFFLENARVALSEGGRFGEPGNGYVRLNFATSTPILQEILDRMDHALAVQGEGSAK